MAKRFTDTEKWKKGFIKGLKTSQKLLWLYILDECDHAGIWHKEIDIAGLRLDVELNEEEVRRAFGDHIVEFDSGEKWFIPDFIDFQYGELNPQNRAHKSVIDKLKKYDLIDENYQFKVSPLSSPLQAPSQGAMDKDKEKDMDMDMDKEKEKEKEKNSKKRKISVPETALNIIKHVDDSTRLNGVMVPDDLMNVPHLAEAYAFYCQYMKENYSRWPTSTTTQMDLHKLSQLRSQGNDPIKVIAQTIEARNKSFYPLRENFSNPKKRNDAIKDFSDFLEQQGGVV